MKKKKEENPGGIIVILRVSKLRDSTRRNREINYLEILYSNSRRASGGGASGV